MSRFKLFIVGALLAFGCSPGENDNGTTDLVSTVVLKSANLEQEDIGMVNGTLFFVNDFNAWFSAYSKVTKGLIISLRNVDDPNINLVFEGSKNNDDAVKRVELLTSKSFLEKCTAQGDPMSNYYKIEYYSKISNPTKHYFAISFTDTETRNWIDFVSQNEVFFEEMGITVAGIGTNPDINSEVYILFRQKDFVSFRKELNSPRKIKRFLEAIAVPEDALISYWVRTSEPA
jgi:hypothetical protein